MPASPDKSVRRTSLLVEQELAKSDNSISQVVEIFREAALAAGAYIFEQSKAQASLKFKEDGSIVSNVDVLAELLVRERLSGTLPSYPFVGEESAAALTSDLLNSQILIMVDTLDGTREFVSGSPEYTVNIGLVAAGEPVCGVVFAPALGEMFWGSTTDGAYKAVVRGKSIMQIRKIVTRPHKTPVIFTSKSRGDSPAVRQFIDTFSQARVERLGSSLKFCRLAEGLGDFYPCFGDTYEWDTTAGHAILNAAGGKVIGLDNEPLRYGKAEPLSARLFLNPNFIATADSDYVLGHL